MAASENPDNAGETDVGRGAEDIRHDIAIEKDNISLAVEQMGERIREKFDWREYVRDSPYLAAGAAVGLGYLASRMCRARTTPLERIMDSIEEKVRDSLDGLHVGDNGPGLIKITLLGIATQLAAGLVKNATATPVAGDDETQPGPEREQTLSRQVDT